MGDDVSDVMVVADLAMVRSGGDAEDAIAILCDAIAALCAKGDFDPQGAFPRISETFEMFHVTKYAVETTGGRLQ